MSSNKRKGERRRRSTIVEIANGFLSLLVLGIVVTVGLGLYGLYLLGAPGNTTADSAFFVEKGNGLATIATRLEEQKLVDNAYLFRAGAWLYAREARILPGEYAIPARASARDILDIIVAGKPVEHFVTVPEGETAFQAAARLRVATNRLSGDLVADPAEGTILPDRYDFLPMDSRQSVLDKMTKAMTEAVAEIWATHDPAIDDVIKSPADLVTLASIVEKETSLASERPQIAAVFINRLRRHMRLQTDPTVLYGVTLGKTVLSRGPTTAELRAKTAYNTYQIDGLPVGPIANPGIDALKAVAHPADSKDLYFVAKTADPKAGHLFSTNYAQHKKNVALYRKAVKAQNAAEAEAEADAAKEALEAEQAAQSGDTAQ